MNASKHDLGVHRPLFEALFTAFVEAGKAVLPEGHRQGVVDLLTLLVADPDLFEAYLDELTERRAALGQEGELRLLKAPRTDIPWAQIRKGGFGELTPEVLADLATSPEALGALVGTEFGGEEPPGPWFFAAIERVSAERSMPAANHERGRQKIAEAENQLNAELPSTKAEVRSATPKTRRWVQPKILLQIAAGIFLGFLMAWAFRGERNPYQLYAATAAVKPVTVRGNVGVPPIRGDEIVPEVRVTAPFDGFVVVLALAPDRKQRVFPEFGTGDRAGAAGRLSEPILLPKDTTHVLYVVTETPAGETVRMAFADRDSRRFSPEQLNELRQDLQALLKRKGYRRIAFGDSKVAPIP